MSTIHTPYPSYPRPARPSRPETPVAPAYPLRRQSRPARRSSTWPLLVTTGAVFGLILLSALLLAGSYFYLLLSGRALPGVMAGTIPAGGKTQAELAQALDAEWNHQPRILVSDGARNWAVTPIELGLWLDPQATAARAIQVGRGDQSLGEALWLARFGQIQVEPVVVFNAQAARTGLQKLSERTNHPAQNASLRMVNGQWTAVPGVNGTSLNVDQTLLLIAAQPQQMAAGAPLHLLTQSVAPRVSDLTPVLAQLRGALERPLRLQAVDPIRNETINIPVPQETLASWIQVDPAEDSFTLRLDGAQVDAYLEQWQASLAPERRLEAFTPPDDLTSLWQSGQAITVRVLHNPTQYTVESGDTLTRIAVKVGMPYWKIQQANPGIDANHLSAGQILTIPSKDEMLPLPVVYNKRIVVSISEQRMWTYENGSQLKEYVISTGIDRSPTNPGIYQVRTHEVNAYASAWDLWMPHFMGIYEGWPGFMNGIHGLPTLSNGRLLWAGYLGKPISYGCIVMGLDDAEEVYQWADAGVIVEIRP